MLFSGGSTAIGIHLLYAQRDPVAVEKVSLCLLLRYGGKYFLKKGLLCKNLKQNSEAVVIPRCLVPFVIASYHFQTHAGPRKLLSLIQLNFTWKGMLNDITEFCKGCVLCSIFKSSTLGPNEVGTPRIVTEPAKYWQIDVCSGLVSVKGSKSFLTMIDLYTGFVVPVQLKTETSEEIAKVIEENLIKVFGPPREISSDNAANLTGLECIRLI